MSCGPLRLLGPGLLLLLSLLSLDAVLAQPQRNNLWGPAGASRKEWQQSTQDVASEADTSDDSVAKSASPYGYVPAKFGAQAAARTATPTPTLTQTETPTPIYEPQQGTEDEYRTIVINYRHPVQEGVTVYTATFLNYMRDIESRIKNVSGWSDFCKAKVSTVPVAGQNVTTCEPLLSPVTYAFHPVYGYLLDLERVLAQFENTAFIPMVGRNFPTVQNAARTFLKFGGPLANFTTVKDRVLDQHWEFMLWFNRNLRDVLLDVQSEYAGRINITYRGGPLQYYETMWAKYKTQQSLALTFQRSPDSETTRFSLFVSNVKRLEYLANIKPGASAINLFHPYVHLTHLEFLRAIYALESDDVIPDASVFTMWNIDPDMTDYYYPPTPLPIDTATWCSVRPITEQCKTLTSRSVTTCHGEYNSKCLCCYAPE